MELTLIEFLKPHLGGMQGYISKKSEGANYPAFIIDSNISRGESIYSNKGKPLGYDYDIQINLIDTRYVPIRALRDKVIELLDGFTGELGEFQVIDCQLTDGTLGMNINKNYECVLFFKIKTK